jgi:hypothetical protein
MTVLLCPYPTPSEKVTVEDYKEFISKVKDLIQQYD